MPVDDTGTLKMVRGQLARRYVDSTRLDVRVSYGTVYVTGWISKLKLHPEIDLKQEIEAIGTILRSKPGVGNIIWDARIRT